MKLTLERAEEILKKHTTEEHLFTHALAVSSAMGAMAEHFGEVDEEDIRAIISHGYGLCTEEVKPETNLEKSLFAVDELTGIVMACALMRPTGITDLEVSSLKKKFKDKKFAAKCNREIIKQGAETLGMPLEELMELTIKGMRTEADALGLGAKV